MSPNNISVSNDKKGSAYVLLSGLLYGLIGYFGVSITQHNLSINNMLFWRFLIACFAILVIILIRKNSYKINYSHMLKSFIYGALFYSGGAAIYFYAAKYIGTGLSMTIFFIYPTIIILFNWLKTKQKLNKIYCIAIIFSLIGMLLLIDRNKFTFDLYGIILAIISAISYAIYIICSKQQLETLPPLISTLMVSLGSCTLFFIISLIEEGQFIIPSSTAWPYIIGMGIICTALPILLLLEGLKYISSEKTAILSVLEPVAVVIFGILLLNEKISLLQTIGVLVMLSSAVIIQFNKLCTKDKTTP